MQNGTVTESGSYSDLLMNDSAFSDLMQKFGLENAKKEKKADNDKEAAPQEQVAEKKEGSMTMAEERETGFVSLKMYYKYVIFGGAGLFLGYFLPLLLSAANQVVINWWLTQWTTDVFKQSLGFCKLNFDSITSTNSTARFGHLCWPERNGDHIRSVDLSYQCISRHRVLAQAAR